MTDKLRDDSPSPILAESYSEAVDELEHLMHSLSNLFENFAPKQNGDKKQNGGNDGPAFSVGEPGKILKIVAELNKLMMDTKETKIWICKYSCYWPWIVIFHRLLLIYIYI